MLDAVCRELRNYFVKDIYKGPVEIADGSLSPSEYLKDGQYYCLVGSVFNDGVHQFPNDVLTDEEFEGEVWAMGVPPSLIALTEKIKAFVDSEGAQPSPFTAESFAGYSYQRATTSDGMAVTWQDAFRRELNRWRKI